MELMNKERLEVVDALRGFALLAIVLLHNLEHYNLFFYPENTPVLLGIIDKGVWETLFFIFAGKAYATFSLLFGFSFYIQIRNARRRGDDFRLRFAWRMFLLMLFAMLHSVFYNGDILLLYAVAGLLLIPICNLKDKTVLIIAIILLLQPLEIFRAIYYACNPEQVMPHNFFVPYAESAQIAGTTGSFAEVIRSNVMDGILYSNLWQIEAGRLFQTPALFMLGLLLGRREYFIKSDTSKRFWRKAAIYAVIIFIPFYILRMYLPEHIANLSVRMPVYTLFYSLSNFSFMAMLVSLFTLLWFKRGGYKAQRFIIPYGRMSLTNYITQSIIGVCIYYQFGGGLYKYTGALATVLIGCGIFAVQLIFSRIWLSRHKQGPLEYLWKRGTWICSKR